MAVSYALLGLWAVWAASWLAAALWSTRAATQPPLRQEAVYRAVTLVGAVLLFANFGRGGPLNRQLWVTPPSAGGILVIIAMMGFAFTWWARLHLGALWSGSITRKHDHHIVDTGPYRLVRHPIYTGILVALYATALERGSVLAIIGAAIMTLGFIVKARLEESFLGTELGPGAYARYRRRVPMLVPFWPAN